MREKENEDKMVIYKTERQDKRCTRSKKCKNGSVGNQNWKPKGVEKRKRKRKQDAKEGC